MGLILGSTLKTSRFVARGLDLAALQLRPARRPNDFNGLAASIEPELNESQLNGCEKIPESCGSAGPCAPVAQSGARPGAGGSRPPTPPQGGARSNAGPRRRARDDLRGDLPRGSKILASPPSADGRGARKLMRVHAAGAGGRAP